MHSTRIHTVIDRTISFFRRIGIWHEEVGPLMGQLRLKLFYSIYYLFFVISLSIGSITSETADESIFLAEAAIIIAVFTIKIWMLIWKQKQIMRLLNRICVFSIRNDQEYVFFNEKVEKFIKFVTVFSCVTVVVSVGNTIFPFFGNGKLLLLDIAFPLDWKNSEIGFWMAYIFFFSENVLSFLPFAFSVIIWYLLLHCSLRYKILGMEIGNMGRRTDGSKVNISVKEQQAIFYQDLVASIEAHLHLRGLIDELESFLSKLFLLEFATSGLCICGSIYCLAFDISDHFVERVVHIYMFFYHTAELFMITYFGNEILVTSGRLSFSLFEADWVDQPPSTTKCIIIFGEYLRQSHQLLIGRLYPLTLETFTRILKSSYSLFNILKNTKQ
ncbi:putative odorant receptor 71a [Bradysia coprophila]|uniref:putative odorant receptor 71a n=1 Tax=Bradysia coprophila TaxID=38358 RepID=UPI00187DB6AE|nr:putative odorant receptor 71a [Bradysia coprophila]